jgi:DNA-binding transcriptional regulator of glucitol operon
MTPPLMMERVMLRTRDERITATQTSKGRSAFAAGPVLAELLSDPMTHQLMAADRVEYRQLEAVLQEASSQLPVVC